MAISEWHIIVGKRGEQQRERTTDLVVINATVCKS